MYGSVEMAEAKHEEWKKAVEIAKKKQLQSTHIEQIPPPGKDVSHLNIERITHVSSPSMFWVQTTEVSHNVERLHTIIEHSLRNCPQVGSIYDVKVGNMFLAPFKDPSEKEIHFYRARVNAIMEKEKVVVFFIDYGNVEIVDYRNLRVMSAGVVQEFSELVTIPGLAHECCLASVQPDRLRSSKGLWDDEVIKKFKNLLLGHVGGNIVSRIFSVTRSGSGHNKYVTALETIEVKLADNSTVDVRRQLLEDKLMDQAVESFLSQDDHRERLRFAAYGSAMQEHVKNPYSSASLLPKVDVHFQQERRLQPLSVPLQGPFSPLEHKVHCAYRGGGIKAVNVDQESVNAVMLDASPSNPHDQWMVAAHVAMSPSSESLQIRNTTWLPSKPGFGAMATMMFAPQVELRVNKAKTKLTGFVAGLGPKMIWDKPMDRVSRSERTHSSYPEHDIEVKFDVNITNSDIDKINKMRYWMNQMMMKTEDGIMHISQPKSLDAAQKGLQRNLLLLLEEARHHEEKVGVPCGHEYR